MSVRKICDHVTVQALAHKRLLQKATTDPLHIEITNYKLAPTRFYCLYNSRYY